jgi:high-affinity Fe2+/Pb2+ permease
MTKANDFKNKTLRQIRVWAWMAAVLPISALAGLTFVWIFFDKTVLGYAFIIGETVMFTVAVVWWWWAIYTIRNLLNHWDGTREKVIDVLDNVVVMRQLLREQIQQDKAK